MPIQRVMAQRLWNLDHVAVFEEDVLRQILPPADVLIIEGDLLRAPKDVDFGALGEFRRTTGFDQRLIDRLWGGQGIRASLTDFTRDVVLLASYLQHLDDYFGVVEVGRQLIRDDLGKLLDGQAGSF